MTAPRAAPTTDVGVLLGLTGRGARVLAGLYATTMTVLALTTGALQSAAELTALFITLVAAVVLVTPGSYPLRWPPALGVLGAVASCTALVVVQLPPTGDPGYHAWNFGACSFLLFTLGLRGRIALAWLGMALVLVITCWWSWGVSGSILHGVGLVYGQAASLLAGSFFAYGLRRTAQRIIEFQETEQRQIAAEQARESSAEHRDLELARVRARAEAALLQIASGRTSMAEREEHRLLEASLRDEIRGRSLAIEPITSAARDARERGIDVLLLDDSGDLAPSAQAAVTIAAWVADRLRTTTSETVIVRLAPQDNGLVTTVASSDDTAEPEQLILRH